MLTLEELNIKIKEKEGIEKRSRYASKFFLALGILSSILLANEILSEKKYLLLFVSITAASFPLSYCKYRARKNASAELLCLREEAMYAQEEIHLYAPLIQKRIPKN